MKVPLVHRHAAIRPTPPHAIGSESSALETAAAADLTAGVVVISPRRRPWHRAGTAARSSASRVGRGAGEALARLPGVLRFTQAGARSGVEALETLPDGTLRSLTAAALGLGAGLSFTRAGRLGALAGAVPAAVMAAVLIRRPTTAGSAKAATR